MRWLILLVLVCTGAMQGNLNAQNDADAPVVMSVYPTPDGEALNTRRPVVRVEFNEELDWTEATYVDCVSVTDKDGNVYGGTLEHSIVNDKSILHFSFNDDLPLDKAFLVKVKGGLTDLSGNRTEDFYFRFLSEYRPLTAQMLHSLDEPFGFWAPDGSGTSKGLYYTYNTDENGGFTEVCHCTFTTTGDGYSKLHYEFDPASSDKVWQIREYYSHGDITGEYTGGVISVWIYGDGSYNEVSVCLRTDFSGGSLRYKPLVLDFCGWKLYSWDLTQDESVAFTGNYDLNDNWKFDSFLLRHTDASGTTQQWSGDVCFDELQWIKPDESAVRKASINDVAIPSSIADVTDDNNPIVIGGKGRIIITGNAEGVAIFDVTGVRQARCEKLSAGWYIVIAGGKIHRVVVR